MRRKRKKKSKKDALGHASVMLYSRSVGVLESGMIVEHLLVERPRF